MVVAVIVCSYGKNMTKIIIDYVESTVDEITKKFALKGEYCRIIVSGGNTEAGDCKWRTEASMMKVAISRTIAKKSLPDMISVEAEHSAYNTLTNILFSKQVFGNEINNFSEIIIVCNKAYFIKNVFACIKVFGVKTVSRKVSFCPFPLTVRKRENIKILLKTGPEVIGYFIRPIGRRLEYWQWKIRIGRNERINFWQFCQRFMPKGELL